MIRLRTSFALESNDLFGLVASPIRSNRIMKNLKK
jgi:hypothetical protein